MRMHSYIRMYVRTAHKDRFMDLSPRHKTLIIPKTRKSKLQKSTIIYLLKYYLKQYIFY